jgi:hypothetical protein
MLLLKLLIVGWLPGAILFRLPIANRDRRAALPAEERAFWALALSAAVSLTIVLALSAVDAYSFSALLVADLGLVVLLGAACRFRVTLGKAAPRPGLTALIPIALVALGIWRFFPSSEYVIGGKDPGVYINEGIQMAQRGTLVIEDEIVSSVPADARDLFFPSHQNPTYYSTRFMGFFIKSPERGTVVGQFPHLYPASIAVGYGLDGLTGARRTVGVWAILGLLAVYFAGARLLGWPSAAAGALLLALSVVQVWFSRYPNAEVVMQALLFAALLANARAAVDRDDFFAPVAGALLGLLLFLRFDAVIGIAGVIAGAALGVVAGHRLRWTFWPPLVVASLLCLWYLAGPMRAYFEYPLVFFYSLRWWQWAALVLAIALAIASVTTTLRSPVVSRAVVKTLPTIAALIVVALAIYALFFRHPAGKLTDYDAYALRMYANYYVTLAGLAAALVGYVLVSRGLFWRDPALLLTITGFALFFFYRLRIVPVHFWTARRFVAVILPGTLLLAAGAALAGVRGRWFGSRAIRAPIGIIFLGLLALNYARVARPVLNHVEYAGIIPKLEHIAGQIGNDDLLVVESRDASDVHVLGLPLAYIYARNVLVLASAAPDKPHFAGFLEWAARRYHRVLFMGGGGTDLLSSQWSVEPISSERFQIPEYDAPVQSYPTFVRKKEFDYSLYAFARPSSHHEPFDLDVGISDDLNVIRFDAKERTEGHTFRWSQDQSFIVITRFEPDERTIAIWMSNGGRPPAAPPADVTILIGDRTLGTLRVGNGFSRYDFPVPPDLAAAIAASGEPVRLTMRTTTWNPFRVLGTPDDRDLGVMVDRVAVR